MKKRDPLAKLIGALATRPGAVALRSERASGAAAAGRRVSARKPPAHVDPSERVVAVPPTALQGSPILAALAEARRAGSPRQPKAARRRAGGGSSVPRRRAARRAARAS